MVTCTTWMLGLMALAVCGLPVSAQDNSPKMNLNHAIRFAVSPPLRELAKLPPHEPYGVHEEMDGGPIHVNFHPGRVLKLSVDSVEQRSLGRPSSISTGLSIA